MPTAIRTLANLKDKTNKELAHAIKEGKYILWNDYIKYGANKIAPASVEYKKGMPMIMVYSSGTTGASKAIVLTNDGINTTIMQYDVSLFFEKKEVTEFFIRFPYGFRQA